MNPGATICQLPTWDYAMAGYLISSLPQEIRNVLTRTEMLCLQSLVYLCGLQARKSGRQALYATPSHRWLGVWAGRSDRTVRRSLTKLFGLHLLQRRRRWPVRGQPQTNLYQLGGQLLALLRNVRWPKTLAKSHKAKNVRKRPKERSRPGQNCAEVVDTGFRSYHKPADLAALPRKEGANRLTPEEARHGFALIYSKITGKA